MEKLKISQTKILKYTKKFHVKLFWRSKEIFNEYEQEVNRLLLFAKDIIGNQSNNITRQK